MEPGCPHPGGFHKKPKGQISRFKHLVIPVLIFIFLSVIICGPAATWLQSQKQWAAPEKQWDAVYLVCGAHAQNNRIKALDVWLQQRPVGHPSFSPILIGNDPQQGLWCRKHQTNHTVSAWAVEKISDLLDSKSSSFSIQRSALSTFSTTDGEMKVLADYLKFHPEIKSIALVTSRYHARRAQQRLRYHLNQEQNITIGIIPGIKRIHNRNPITVTIEHLKIVRDNLGLSHAPIISRPQAVDG